MTSLETTALSYELQHKTYNFAQLIHCYRKGSESDWRNWYV